MQTGIYSITNRLNGHVYIGSSVDIKRRWRKHRWFLKTGRHPNSHLQRAINKYGIENFAFTMLMICHADDLILYEQQFIDQLRPEYNLLSLAGSSLGYKFSDVQRIRASITHKGKAMLSETKKKISVSMTGRKRSDESKAKQVLAQIGKQHSAKSKLKMSAAKKGKKREPLTEEHKAKISVAKKKCFQERREAYV